MDPETVLPEAGLEPAFKGDGVNGTGVAVDGAGGVVNGNGGGLGLDALAEKGSEDWPYEEELYVRLDIQSVHPLHPFLLARSSFLRAEYQPSPPLLSHPLLI